MNLKEAQEKIGQEWTTKRGSRVRILGTKKVEESYYPSGSWRRDKRMITRVEVEVLDPGTGEVRSTACIPAADLDWMPWARKAEMNDRAAIAKAEQKARVKRLQTILGLVLGDDDPLSPYSVLSATTGGGVEITLRNGQADRLIAALERLV